MSQVLPVSSSCCSECDTSTTVNVPGAAGAAGAAGTAGTDGVSSYTYLSSLAGFTQPAVNASVDITVVDNRWMSPGQCIYIGTGGYYQVVTVNGADQTLCTVKNLLALAKGNADVGSAIPANEKVSPAGYPGLDGDDSAGGTYLAIANNLSDLNNAATARTNLGLGTAAVVNANTLLATSTIGVTVEAYDAALASLATAAAASVADRLPYFSAADTFSLATYTALARTLTACATELAMRNAIRAGNRYGLLAYKLVDFNDADTEIDINVSDATTRKYIIRKVTVVYDASALDVAAGILRNAALGGGSALTSSTVFATISSAGKFLDMTLVSPATDVVQTAEHLYLNLSLVQAIDGTTGKLFIWGDDLSGSSIP